MIDNNKVVTLIRLRDLLYVGVQPTLRECGFSAEIVQGLVKEQMLRLGHNQFDADPDRCVIEEILPAGHAFISQQHAIRDRHNLDQLSHAEAG